MAIKIKEMKTGDTSMIAGYEQGNNYYRQKLLSMGLIKGTRIKLLKIAPLGDPVQIELRGFKLSLRKKEAEILILEKEENLQEEEQYMPDLTDNFFSMIFGKKRKRHRGGKGHSA